MLAVLTSKSKSWNLVERLIFPAPTASYNVDSFPGELIFIPRFDGQKVPCLLLPFKHARFLVLYFHANAEDLGLCYSFCKIMRDLFMVHVLAVEYPGYGICAGTTDEAGIMANAQAAMYFAMEALKWPSDGIKLFGRSIGTGPAVTLATQFPVAGVVLVSPFTSIQALFRQQVGRLADFVGDRFNSGARASKISSSTLIIHGQQDTLIPMQHGQEIYDSLQSRKMMVCPAGMGHNTSLLKNISTFVLPMTQFFSLPDYTFEDIEVPEWVFPGREAPSAGAPPPAPDEPGEDPLPLESPRVPLRGSPDPELEEGLEGLVPLGPAGPPPRSPDRPAAQPVRTSQAARRALQETLAPRGATRAGVHASRGYAFAAPGRPAGAQQAPHQPRGGSSPRESSSRSVITGL